MVTHPTRCTSAIAWCWVRPLVDDIGLDFWKCNAIPILNCRGQEQTIRTRLAEMGR